MRAILHIGVEKTGTTALQECFVLNRERLLAAGVNYPRSLWGPQHWALALYAIDDGRSTLLGDRQPGFLRDRAGWRESVAERLGTEIDADGGEILLLSSELLAAQLVDATELVRLRGLLDRWCDEYAVVVYLRRQDRATMSLYSTELRAGSTSDEILGRHPFAPMGFDYARLLDLWSGEFGRSAVTVRVYDNLAAAGVDLVDDFVDAAELPVDSTALVRPAEPVNPALSAWAQQLLLMFNRRAGGPARGPESLRLRHALVHELEQSASGPSRRPSAEQARAYLAEYVADNTRVAADWFGTARLFDEDFGRYPEAPDLAPDIPDQDLESTVQRAALALARSDRAWGSPEGSAGPPATLVRSHPGDRRDPVGVRRLPQVPRPVAPNLVHGASRAVVDPLPQYPDARYRAAVMHFEPAYEDRLAAIVHVLRSNAVDPTVYVNDRIRQLRPGLGHRHPGLRDAVTFVPVASAADRSHLAQEVRESGPDLVVLSAFEHDAEATWASPLGAPILGVVHDAGRMRASSAAMGLVRESRVGVLTLARHVTANLMTADPQLFATTATITSAYPIPLDVTRLPASSRRRIVVPARMPAARGGHHQVLAAMHHVRGLIDPDCVELRFVADERDRPDLEQLIGMHGLGNCAVLAGDVGRAAADAYHRDLASADFVLPLLPMDVPVSRTTAVDPVMAASVGLAVPPVVDRWTAGVYGVPAVEYAAGRLSDGVVQAASMSPGQMRDLQDAVADHRRRELDRAVAEMAFALEAVGVAG